MRVTLHSRLSAVDAARRALYADVEAADGDAFGPAATAASVYPGGHFRSEAHVARRLAHLDRPAPAQGSGDLKSGPARAVAVQEFLRHENAFAPLSPEQRANLEAAGSAHAVYVLTGQQPGLLGGPILWYYKALTCAALARDWTARLGRPVIPVFWVAGDDSDLGECNQVELLDGRAADVRGPLCLEFPDPQRPLAMGERRVEPEQLSGLLKRLSAVWNPETLETFARAYPVPSRFDSGFLRLAQSLLGREGILFVNGYSRNLRAAARPVLEAAVGGWESWHAALAKGTAAAEAAGIPAQVRIREGVVHAFALDGGERRRLFGENRSGGAGVHMSGRPDRNLLASLGGLDLTHDVFSRPLAADAIFPVLGHVLGPAELRYFAQLAPLFLETTGDMPLLQPRMTASVAPASAFGAFLAEGLELPELMRFGPAALRARLTERAWRAHPASAGFAQEPAEKWLAGVRKSHDRHFKDAGPLDRLERDFAAAWKRYQRSLEKAAYGEASPRSRRLFDHLRWLGNGMGQDRHLNLGSLLNALGRDGLTGLRAALDPLETDLQLFQYEGE